MKFRFLYVIVTILILTIISTSGAGILGDINNDGKVDVQEAVYALRVAAGLYPNLPDSCILTGKGSWAENKNYNLCDVVESKGLTYACIQQHTADAANVPPHPTFWNVLSLKGEQGPPGSGGSIKVYDANDQFLGLSSARINPPSGMGDRVDLFIPSLDVFTTIILDEFVGDDQYKEVGEISEYGVQNYVEIDGVLYMRINNQLFRDTFDYEIRYFAGSNKRYVSGPFNYGSGLFKAIEIPESEMPFEQPIALPIRFVAE
jgi:carbohydrate binding protein with CBM5/12 domain